MYKNIWKISVRKNNTKEGFRAEDSTSFLLAISDHSKSNSALFDSQFKHLVQAIVGVVDREAQLIETAREREWEKQEQHRQRNTS